MHFLSFLKIISYISRFKIIRFPKYIKNDNAFLNIIGRFTRLNPRNSLAFAATVLMTHN